MKVIKVVTGDQVENLTSNGWQLVTTHANAQQFVEHRRVVRPGGYYDGNPTYQPEQWKNEVAVACVPLFVLEKDVELLSREHKLEQLLAEERKAGVVARDELSALKVDLDKARKHTEEIRAASARITEDNITLRRTLTSEHARNAKLEADLAKVRTEIGEARWREVVGS